MMWKSEEERLLLLVEHNTEQAARMFYTILNDLSDEDLVDGEAFELLEARQRSIGRLNNALLAHV